MIAVLEISIEIFSYPSRDLNFHWDWWMIKYAEKCESSQWVKVLSPHLVQRWKFPNCVGVVFTLASFYCILRKSAVHVIHKRFFSYTFNLMEIGKHNEKRQNSHQIFKSEIGCAYTNPSVFEEKWTNKEFFYSFSIISPFHSDFGKRQMSRVVHVKREIIEMSLS
jgi:hypothetical protein